MLGGPPLEVIELVVLLPLPDGVGSEGGLGAPVPPETAKQGTNELVSGAKKTSRNCLKIIYNLDSCTSMNRIKDHTITTTTLL